MVGAPSLPPTSGDFLPSDQGTSTVMLLLGLLGAASLAMVVVTMLRQRLLEHVDR